MMNTSRHEGALMEGGIGWAVRVDTILSELKTCAM